MSSKREVFVLEVNKTLVIGRLFKLGAHMVQDARLTDDWYRPKDHKKTTVPGFLRLRSASSGIITVTWNSSSSESCEKNNEEINFTVSSKKQAATLLEKLGLEHFAKQEKDRISFELDDWHFDLDSYPGIPIFLKISGPHADSLTKAIALLHLQKFQTFDQDEQSLAQNKYGLDWNKMSF